MYSSIAEPQLNAVYNYDDKKLNELLSEVIKENVSTDVWNWLQERRSAAFSVSQFNTLFVLIPRKTGKATIQLTEEQANNLQSARNGFSIQGWTIDRLCRVWQLLHLDPSDKEKYHRMIENLFLTAEMNELVALYSSLPLLAYPELWTGRCSEGIRSNIGDVLEAIMCNNPYPSEYLSEPAWNQLVLKAFFTQKPVHRIIGLDQRANQELANTLFDYAHERWAAHRPIHPQLWRCVGKFINEQTFPDIERIATSDNLLEREAAFLACWDTDFPKAKELLNTNTELKTAIEAGIVTWDSLAGKQAN